MTNEKITANEALKRVGLETLCESRWDCYHVVWKGTPTPFSFGHVAVYGLGPTRAGVENDSKGSGRSDQQKVRISQHLCGGGNVLFVWSNAGVARGDLVVLVADTPDSNQRHLRVGWSA